MARLDDLEASRQGWIDNPGASEAKDYFTNLAFNRLPALLAVCRAAVAYREAIADGFDIETIQLALLAATEGLT